jgi:predicted nucleotidyltransferase component of viral defense system
VSNDLERSIKDRVREIAKAEHRTFNVVWKTLVLERFLARLSRATQVNNLIFKGGMLLSKYIPLGRETADLDFLAVNLAASVDAIRVAIENILNTPLQDGFSFTELSVELLTQPHMNYPGYAVNTIGVLGGTRTAISIDIGIGDVVEMANKDIEFLALKSKPLFESSVALKVYPLEYIFAEKLETVIYRGAANSRMKDFFDLWFLLKRPGSLDEGRQRDVLIQTFKNRGTAFQLTGPILTAAEAEFHRSWASFRRGLSNEIASTVPESFFEIVTEIDRWMTSKGLVKENEAV